VLRSGKVCSGSVWCGEVPKGFSVNQVSQKEILMAQVENFTNPLSGSEVVADVLAQIKKRLTSDCNVRPSDGYSGGYSGKVTISLSLHAVRIATVEMEIPITEQIEAPGIESFSPEDVFPIEIDEQIVVPIEPNLKEVRQRTQENNEEISEHSDPVDDPETPAKNKRKYTRRALVGAVSE
jgi:hypothetical protein